MRSSSQGTGDNVHPWCSTSQDRGGAHRAGAQQSSKAPGCRDEQQTPDRARLRAGGGPTSSVIAASRADPACTIVMGREIMSLHTRMGWFASACLPLSIPPGRTASFTDLPPKPLYFNSGAARERSRHLPSTTSTGDQRFTVLQLISAGFVGADHAFDARHLPVVSKRSLHGTPRVTQHARCRPLVLRYRGAWLLTVKMPMTSREVAAPLGQQPRYLIGADETASPPGRGNSISTTVSSVE